MKLCSAPSNNTALGGLKRNKGRKKECTFVKLVSYAKIVERNLTFKETPFCQRMILGRAI